MNEQEAIDRLRQGDIRGLDALVRRYQVKAVHVAYLITHDRMLAEDVVQSAFLQAFDRIEQFDGTRSFSPWFLKSVANRAIKSVTRGKPTLSGSEAKDFLALIEDSAPGPHSLLERKELIEVVREALVKLPAEQRGAIVLRYYLGLNEAEMAENMDVPPGTIKWRLHAARQKLQGLLVSIIDEKEN